MKDKYRWYAELPESRGSKSGSKRYPPFTRLHLANLIALGLHHNCVAVPLDDAGQPLWQRAAAQMMDAYTGVNDQANAAVLGTSVQQEYLRKRCVRITADMARSLHPKLFNYLKDLT